MTYSPIDERSVLRRSGYWGIEEWFGSSFNNPAWATSASGSASIGLSDAGIDIGESGTSGDFASVRGIYDDKAYSRTASICHLVYASDDNSSTLPSSEFRIGWGDIDQGTSGKGMYYDYTNNRVVVSGDTVSLTDTPSTNTQTHVLIKSDRQRQETTFRIVAEGITGGVEEVTVGRHTRPIDSVIAYYESNAGANNYAFELKYAGLGFFTRNVDEFDIPE